MPIGPKNEQSEIVEQLGKIVNCLTDIKNEIHITNEVLGKIRDKLYDNE